MLICDDGTTVGSLSAGCIEDEVVLRAGKVFTNGRPTLITFDTRRRFGCAGKIDIFIERASDEFFADLARCLDARRSCSVVTVFEGTERGSRIEVAAVHRTASEDRPDPGRLGQSPLPDNHQHEPPHELVHEIRPPVRLLIFGEGPDNAPFQSLGHLLGWETTVIADPEALAFQPDDWTAALVKSHNYGRDFVALEKLLAMKLAYVGLIGPRRRRDQLMNALLDIGVTVNRGFFAPAGLDVGAETPEEIALAIVSEIQRVFGNGSGTSLRERKTAIHQFRPRPETIHQPGQT
jgi:xanthine/CO dehydrogenase XdhC/CoxF family maturation factor